MTPPPVTLAIIGAGKRGEAYADYAKKHPDQLRVAAVAEPRKVLRERLANDHKLPPERCYDGYEAFAREPKLCDAVAICTQDRMHLAPVEALAPKGYAILLEKPLSHDPEECARIVACVRQHGNLFACCHVLLYTELTRKLRELLRGGVIGDIVSMQHLEPVAWWHQAHSFVRGNWRNSAESSFMLLSKSCHDIDWMRHIIDRPCRQVVSFGSLRHFKASEKPPGAADRCLECLPAIERQCPYSATKLYLDSFGRDWIIDYLNDVITAGNPTRESVRAVLASGPYGRCVYACDNDVVDHQTVMLECEGPVTATFTMTAFTPTMHRATRIFGTRGFIETDFVRIKVFDFLTERETVHDTAIEPDSSTAAVCHGGGDYHIMHAFVHAVATGDLSLIHSGPDETLASHRIVFAAEQSRREGRLIQLPQGC
ncbi:MAG: Gfo/Idh/MocA family oxidoreductase [Verrucomicrobia bacterium]|nr:Gfo/Idh/MocA family oxidoreductase [Verrucomicrobiota bacterium]